METVIVLREHRGETDTVEPVSRRRNVVGGFGAPQLPFGRVSPSKSMRIEFLTVVHLIAVTPYFSFPQGLFLQ